MNNSEVVHQVLFTSEQPKKNKMAFVGILSQIKLLFDPLFIQLVWYILKCNILPYPLHFYSVLTLLLLGSLSNDDDGAEDDA